DPVPGGCGPALCARQAVPARQGSIRSRHDRGAPGALARSGHGARATVDPVTDDHTLEVAGRDIEVTSPGKVFFSERGETKLDLVRYYLAVAEPLMNVAAGRPTLMQRFPNGAEGTSFFQKRVPETAPDWLQTTIVSTPNGTTSRALVLADLAHVVWA